jgi:hypothetical protein
MTPAERDVLIRTVHSEAGAEPDEGKAAVIHTINNRLMSGRFGDSIPEIVFARNQFEGTRSRQFRDLSPRSVAYQRIGDIVDGVAGGDIPDNTGGALHFYAPDLQSKLGRRKPKFDNGDPTAVIGRHHFFSGGPLEAINKAIGADGAPGSALAYTATPGGSGGAPAGDDLLGSWAKSAVPPAAAPAAPANGRPRIEITRQVPAADGAAPASDDLLSAWSRAAAPQSAPAATPAAAQAAAAVPPSQIGRTIADVTGAQGDTWGATGQRVAGGFGRGVMDVVDTGAQGIDWATRKITSALGVDAPAATERGERLQAKVAADRAAYEGAAGDSTAALVGRIGGNIAATAPAGGIIGGGLRAAPFVGAQMAARPLLVGAPLLGAATGGVSAGLTSAASDAPIGEQLLTGAGYGAVAGPVAGLVTRGVGRAFGSAVDAATARLARTARNQYGIDVTAGQISENPTVRFLDSVLQRLPFTGYGARTAQQQGAFNRAISQTFGEDAERITHDTMRQARTRIGQVFDDVATRTGPIPADRRFLNDLTRIGGDAHNVLEASQMRPLQNQILSIAQKVDPRTNSISPEAYQAITRKGAPLDRLSQSTDPNLRHYAGQIREALDDVMHRAAPADVAADLATARAQWRALKTVEPLVKNSTTGNISPQALLNKAAKSYPRGNGDLTTLGQIGRRFLAEPPSSGTAERSMLLSMLTPGVLGLTGAGALGGATYFDPDSWQRNLALGVGGLAATRIGAGALRSDTLTNALIRRGLAGPGTGVVGNAFQGLLPPATALTERDNRLIAAP